MFRPICKNISVYFSSLLNEQEDCPLCLRVGQSGAAQVTSLELSEFTTV